MTTGSGPTGGNSNESLKPEEPAPKPKQPHPNGFPGPTPAQLRALRLSKGWSMVTMSEKTGLSMGFISKHETPGSPAKYRKAQLAKLRAVFGSDLTTPKSDEPKGKVKLPPYNGGPRHDPGRPTTKAAYPDRLAQAVGAVLNDLLSDDLPQPLVSYTNGLYQITATVWGGKTLSYRVPEGQTVEDTCKHVSALAGSLVSNPYN